jgi:hypothetical protein
MAVDVVYTWVDFNNDDWQSEYNRTLSEFSSTEGVHSSVHSRARYTNRNEIYYSILSLLKYAPWVQTIYILTNCKLPWNVEGLPKVRKVSHEEVFIDTSVLPVFNSHAIEANLHRIPGLAEDFIYFNDDFFVCSDARETDFFSEEGRSLLFPSKHTIPYGKPNNTLRPVDHGAKNAGNLLDKEFGYRPRNKLLHAPYPLKKSVLLSIEQKYAAALKETSSHKFRDETDIPLATTMYAYYSLYTGKGEAKSIECRYVDIANPLFVLLVHRFSPLRRGKYKFLCLNEVDELKYFNRLRDWLVVRLMKKMFC